jgi:hypothetical protein
VKQDVPWTDQDIEQLKFMLKAGFYYGDIGKALGGRSRSSIAGKVNRMGLSENRPAVQLPKPMAAFIPKKLAVKEACNTSYRQGGEVPMIALDKGMCKWPMFDRAGFCGNVCGNIYCDEHEKIGKRQCKE